MISEKEPDWFDGLPNWEKAAHRGYQRIARAAKRGTGCRLDADTVAAMALGIEGLESSTPNSPKEPTP